MTAQPVHDDGFGLLPTARSDIAEMSRKARQSVLAPAQPGAWPVEWRHAVAARICRQHAATGLAEGYLAQVDDPALRPLGDPANSGRDAVEQTVLGFVDRVATRPRDILAGDIAALQAAGVADADVVRLCEMAAFLAYQCRVARGLSLIKGAGA